MIEFLSGAVTMGFLVAAGFFFSFWRKTADRLFLAFAAAFVLFALNQALAAGLTVVLEPASLIYGLRVLGFILILAAIIDKNTTSGASTASGARRK
jgi:ABC-type polysaccharide/polyol phosphate export permease